MNHKPTNQTTNRGADLDKLKFRLDEWNAGLDMANDQVPATPADEQFRYEARIAKIREHQAEAQRKFIEIQAADIGTWKELRNGAGDGWHRLKAAVTEARSQLR